MGPIGGDCLFKYLISNHNLNFIAFELGYNGLTHEGTELLVGFIKNNDKLVTFNIGGNYFYDEGIQEMCKSVSQSSSKSKLSYIDFQNNNISKLGCEYIYHILVDSSFINGICLKNNFLNNEGACKVFSALSNENSKINKFGFIRH
jgi:Ran GTPase-activating protein (RanGAP) involved in mRNA processing and transport